MRGPGNWLKRTRAGLLGAFACLLLGAAGHAAAGGRLPGATGLAGIFVVLAVLCGAVSALRRHRFAATALMLGLVQSVLHLVFHAMSGGHGGHTTQSGGGHMAHSAHMEHMSHTGHGGVPTGSVAPGHSMDAGMTLAHTLAALGASVCLIHGERLLARLSRLLLSPLPRPFVPATVPVPPKPPTGRPDRPLPPSHGVLLARTRTRRGPPPVTYA
ncbi:hypothetical protein [Streptomyces sp. NRRL F-5065]|uniref:hypothetical protein n=1 Tax=Streptomyces sp. NRRL F-5065 TaxID=1463855 RepID=UPI001F18C172|nr:hypothetical protein [Streptomyces sp. NRRL F-5065]